MLLNNRLYACVLVVFCSMVDYILSRPSSLKSPVQKFANNTNTLTKRTVSIIPARANIKFLESNGSKTFGHHNVHTHNGALKQGIIFPDEYEAQYNSIPKIENVPDCAKGSTFCEEYDHYPYSRLKKILSQSQVEKDFFGTDEGLTEFKNRLGGADSEEVQFLCSAFERTVFPKIGKTRNNQWRFIVNQGDQDGYVQGVRIETCVKEGSGCDLLSDLPLGYTTSCKQKYVYRRLLSVAENGVAVPDSFQLPSACCCSYKRNIDFLLSRSAKEDNPIEERVTPARPLIVL